MTQDAPHIPVLIAPLIDAVAPVAGVWLDGTYGAGGYSHALLAAGAAQVIGVDRDPDVIAEAPRPEGVTLIEGTFGTLDRHANGVPLQGVVLDIGVSSMQLDRAERGFSFLRDGPLDMRMAQSGPSAADLVNSASERELADILYIYGEERASRRIARAIVADRVSAPFTRTGQLAGLIERLLGAARPGQPHAATRSFQALRIAVNDELGELERGLAAAERALAPGGRLAVVTFHSLEDRIVKRFMQTRSGDGPRANRYAPETQGPAPTFRRLSRKPIAADAAEIAANPRARSARLRVAERLDAPVWADDAKGER